MSVNERVDKRLDKEGKFERRLITSSNVDSVSLNELNVRIFLVFCDDLGWFGKNQVLFSIYFTPEKI